MHGIQKGASFAELIRPLLILTSIFFLNFCSRIVLAPLAPAIESDFGFSHADSGSLFFMIIMGYIISLLGSSIVSSRISHRQTILLSTTGLGVTLLLAAFVSGRWGFRAELFFLGLMAGFYLPSGIAAITGIIDAKHWGKALSVHELAPNVAFVLAPVIAELVMLRYNWRTLFLVLGALALLLSAIFLLFGRGGNSYGMPPKWPLVKSIISNPSIRRACILFMLGISSTFGIYSMLSLFLVNDHGFSRPWANTVISSSRVACIFIPFLAGWIADKRGPEAVLRVVFSLTAISTMLIGLAPTSWIIPIVVLQPLFAVSFFPVGFAVLARICPPEERSLAVSLTIPLSFLIGGGVAPYLIGLIGDAGHLGWGFVLVGLLNSAGVILSGRLQCRSVVTVPE